MVAQAGTSCTLYDGLRVAHLLITTTQSVPKKVVTDVWINPKETVCWNLDSLVTLNVLGRGSFGIVYLVRHRINRQLAALKYIRKKNQNPEKVPTP